jgi:hypothetical protein
MMNSTNITIEKLHTNIKYDIDEWIHETDKKVLMVSWDYENEELDKLMSAEHHPEFSDKLNMMWVNKLIEKSGWVKGEKLYAYLKSNADGYFNIWYSNIKEEIGLAHLIIEPTGFVSRLYFNNYATDQYKDDDIKYYFYIRTESTYNDLICEDK